MAKLVVIAVVGLIGSGKTEATERFIERGFFRVGYNDRLYEEVERRGFKRIERDERLVREDMRQKEGMAVMANRSTPLIREAINRGQNVVIESLYGWSEYKVTKENFADAFRVLAIYAPPTLRYERLAKREVRPLTREEAKARDYAEIENIEKGGPIAMADWTIQNIGTKEEFSRKVDALVENLLK